MDYIYIYTYMIYMDIYGYNLSLTWSWFPRRHRRTVTASKFNGLSLQVQVHWQVRDRSSMRKVHQHDEWIYMDIEP